MPPYCRKRPLWHQVGATIGWILCSVALYPQAFAAGPTVAAIDDRQYVADELTQITAFTLPAATGTGPFTYTLSASTADGRLNSQVNNAIRQDFSVQNDSLPFGLKFDASTRQISGRTITPGSYDLTYTATSGSAGEGATSVSFTIEVVAVRFAGSALPIADRHFEIGKMIPTVTLPAAQAQASTLSYSLSGLPAGLTFNSSTREITGTPTGFEEISFLLTYTVSRAATTYASAASVSENFAFHMYRLPLPLPPPLAFVTSTLSPVAVNAGDAVSMVLPQATGGEGEPGYYLLVTNDSPDIVVDEVTGLPPGLTFNSNTRTLSGTVVGSEASVTYQMLYGADYPPNSFNGPVLAFTFTITAAGETITALTFSPSHVVNQSYPEDTAIATLTLPQASGGTGTLSYNLTASTSDGTLTSADLPAGLSFADSARQLTGTPSAAGTYSMTYTVTDSDGPTATLRFNVVVAADATNPTPLTFSGTQDDVIYKTGDLLDILLRLPEASGSDSLEYRLAASTTGGTLNRDGLPNGLRFFDLSRILTGMPTAIGNYRLVYTALDTTSTPVRSISQYFSILVTPPLKFPSTVSAPVYLRDRAIEPLIWPQATGGTAPRTYTLTATTADGSLVNNLPAGLSFDANTRQLAGTPTDPGTYRMTYQVSDTNGLSERQIVTLRVADTLALPDPPDQLYIADQAIDTLTLPQAIGGIPSHTYTLSATSTDGTVTNKLPAGLSFSASSRQLTGTPTTTGTYVMTYTVTDSDTSPVSEAQSFTLRVTDMLALPGTDNQIYARNRAIATLVLPQAILGSTPYTYTLTATATGGTLMDNLPIGLSFDADSRELTGTPTALGTYTLTYTATDTDSLTATQTFTLSVADPPSLTVPDSQTYIQDQAIATLTLPQATGGTASYTAYTLSATTTDGSLASKLPAGLSFDADSRELTGTPTVPGTYTLTYTVIDSNTLTTTGTFTLIVAEPPTLTVPDNQIYAKDQAIDTLTLPQATGGTEPYTSYTLTATSTDGTVTDNLPAGLSFDDSTRELTGTPTALGTYTLTYTVTDSNSMTATQTFTLTVAEPPTLTDTDNQIYGKGQAIATLTLPQAEGGTEPYTYTLTATTSDGTLTGDDLPTGLSFNANTRELTGTPTVPGIYALTYTVTDTNAMSATRTFTLTVAESQPLALAELNNQTYIKDQAITTLTLPQATGGTEPYTSYTLTATSTGGTLTSDNLPTGLSFDDNTRQLTGTPTALGTYTLTYTVTDSDSTTATRTFTLSVVTEPLSLNALEDQSYTKGQAITALTLPQATGGTEPYTSYTLTATTTGGTLTSDNLPTGLSFDANTRELTGTPTAPGTYTLTYTVTDTDSTTATRTFTLRVVNALALTAPEDQSYTKDQAC